MNEVRNLAATERAASRSPKSRGALALVALLSRVESTLETAVGADSPLLSRLRALHSRLNHERLQLAVLGQFKRGKSTLINALVGAPLLPTGVLPLTAIPTFIAWRQNPAVVVHFQGEPNSEEFAPSTVEEIREILFRFVAEEANPENRLGVRRVDLFYPADLLADGVVIIDTPGVGSTLQHNTEAAMQVLPECDAAFFVVSSDPPITEIELDYLRRLKSKTARIFFVLNKADYLRPEELSSVVVFLRKVLEQKSLIDAEGQIFCISARDALEAKLRGDDLALGRSGVAALEDHLVRKLAHDKDRWLEEAVRSRVADILKQASGEVDLRTRALNMPVEELAAKLDAFQNALRSVEDQRRITRDLLVGDHRRLRDALDSRIDELRREIMARLVRVIDANLSGMNPKRWEDDVRRALSAAIQREFEEVREPLVTAFSADASAALSASQDRVNELTDRVRQIAAEIFDVSLGPDAEHEPFKLGEDPYWVTESVNATLIPDSSRLVERLLPAGLRRVRVKARAIRQAEELVIRNAENLRWAILRGLDETFRAATTRFEERLDQTITTTRNVIRDALARRHDRSFAIQPELNRLAAATTKLARLVEEVRRDSPALPEA